MADKKPLKLESGKLSQMASTDTVPTANLGTGTASATTFLRGDQTWADPIASVTSKILSTTTGIAGTAAASTDLYTVTTGKTCVVTGIVVRLTSTSGAGSGPRLSVGTNAATFNNIMANTNLNAYIATTDVFMYSAGNIYRAGQSTDIIKVIINTVSTYTTWVFSVDLIGYEY